MKSTLKKIENYWVLIIEYDDGSRNDYRFRSKREAFDWTKLHGNTLIDLTEKEFSEKLKQARTAAEMSQQGMADRMLIPKRTIENWEIGERTPPEYVQRFVLNELEQIKDEKARQ